MANLPAHCKWRRFPVKPPKPRTLDHTKLRGKNRAVYPERIFTKQERKAHVMEEWRGQYDGLIENKRTREVINRGYPGLKHRESRKMEPYRKRLNPALRYLSPRQKAHADDVWQPWSWRTAGYATKHFTALDPWGIKRLIGYGGGALTVTAKTHVYERPLIGTNKPKYKLPAMPGTLWGEPERLRIPGTWSFLGYGRPYTERWAFTPKKRRNAKGVSPSFKEGWMPNTTSQRIRGFAWFEYKDGNGRQLTGSTQRRQCRHYYFGAWEQHRFCPQDKTTKSKNGAFAPFHCPKTLFNV